MHTQAFMFYSWKYFCFSQQLICPIVLYDLLIYSFLTNNLNCRFSVEKKKISGCFSESLCSVSVPSVRRVPRSSLLGFLIHDQKEGRNEGGTHGPGWIPLKVHFICTKIEPGWWAVRREDTHSRGTLYWEHLSTLSCAHFLSQAGLIDIPRGNVTVLVCLLFFFFNQFSIKQIKTAMVRISIANICRGTAGAIDVKQLIHVLFIRRLCYGEWHLDWGLSGWEFNSRHAPFQFCHLLHHLTILNYDFLLCTLEK